MTPPSRQHRVACHRLNKTPTSVCNSAGVVSGTSQPAQTAASLGSQPGAPSGAEGQTGDAWLRQLQQGASAAVLASPGLVSDPPVPNSNGPAHAAGVPGPGTDAHIVVTGFRPGSRGPPPGFGGWLPQQPAQQSWEAPHSANGSLTRHTAQGNGLHASAPTSPSADGDPESSHAARGRRRRGKASVQQLAPAPQLSLAPQSTIASLHDTDTLAGRLQQAKEKFYASLNS